MGLGSEVLDERGSHPEPRQRGIGIGALSEVGRSDAHDHSMRFETRALGEWQLVAREAQSTFGDVSLDEVHRRRADERRDEQVRRLAKEPLGRVDLLQHAVAQHSHALPEGHRLDLVVRDVDRRDAETFVEAGELRTHRHAELRVEVRQGLVHQERLRLAHHGATHGDALTLPARELARLAVEELLEPELRRDVADAPFALGFRDVA